MNGDYNQIPPPRTVDATSTSPNATTIINIESAGSGSNPAVMMDDANGHLSHHSNPMFFNDQHSQFLSRPLYSGARQQQNIRFVGGNNNNITDGNADMHNVYEHENNEASAASLLQTPNIHGRRSWRMNLNNVLSLSSTTPRAREVLRSLITHSGGFRYMPISANDAQSTNDYPNAFNSQELPVAADSSNNLRMGRNSSIRIEEGLNSNVFHQQNTSNSEISTDAGNVVIPATSQQHPNLADPATANQQNDTTTHTLQRQNSASSRNTGQQQANANDDDNNVVSEMFINALSHFARYVPFICILLVKFIHDHLLGILDIVLLHGTMYQVNKSLREQIAKFSQKSYGILLRDFSLVIAVIIYRCLLVSTQPDPFGLLIVPPAEHLTIEVSSSLKNANAVNANEQTAASASEMLTNYISQLSAKPQASEGFEATAEILANTVSITKTISLGVLLYYIAVNDLILKLFTILVKISITIMPTKVIRHKTRARMFVLVEYISQFYRAFAPVHHWLIFLFGSYSGLEVISGILFSSFYMGAKGFEFIERGKCLKRSLVNFLRNMDYERKPTNDELNAAGPLCPICHDSFSTPVVLECGHIFCDDCVSTWFKREQTCPMCRAKVSEDPTNWNSKIRFLLHFFYDLFFLFVFYFRF